MYLISYRRFKKHCEFEANNYCDHIYNKKSKCREKLCPYLKLLKKVKPQGQNYKEKLRAFCEGLEMQKIDDLMIMPPEHFRKIGEIMYKIVLDLKRG